MNLKAKLTSRKFWVAIAAALASSGGSIAGIATDNTALVTTGLVCTMLSAAIYAAAEAYVDGKSAASNTTYKQVTATSTDKETVQAALAPAPEQPKKEAQDA